MLLRLVQFDLRNWEKISSYRAEVCEEVWPWWIQQCLIYKSKVG